jgi:EAL domain-containing protein (putative c-di-GMP-specific phosphodiesterase class I)
VEELLSRADSAMYSAKDSGRNTHRFFDGRLQAQIAERVALEIELRQSIERQELFLLYQPQVDSEGRVVGAEALCRWNHAKRGAVSPALFIPLAEDSGFIHEMGPWVLKTACAFLAQWPRLPGMEELSLSVNVSARQFHHPEFVRQVQEVLTHSGANPRQLKLELTESIFADDVEDIVKKMEALRALGVRFSLDDFGTGYSSLSYLKKLPLDQLKIDQSFVRDVLLDTSDEAIVRTVIALGESLGLNVIAEGVETAAQRDFLLRSGCSLYQGYLFSRPIPPAELAAFANPPV